LINTIRTHQMKTIESGIYQITVIRKNKSPMFYIGQSVNLKVRFQTHLWELRNQRSKNPAMQMAFNKYGESSFSFAVIKHAEPCKHVLALEEKVAFDDFTLKHGGRSLYNVNRECMTSRLGVAQSEQTKSKIRATAKARPITEKMLAHIRLLAEKNKGRKLSSETIMKRTEKQKGVKRTAEWKAHMSRVMSGRSLTDETKSKISTTKKLKGQQPTAAHMDRLNEINRARHHDPVHLAKLADMKRGTKKSSEEIAKRTATRRANAAAKGKEY